MQISAPNTPPLRDQATLRNVLLAPAPPVG